MLLQGRYGFSALWEQQPHARLLAQELSTSSSKSSGLIKLLAYDLLGMISPFFKILGRIWVGTQLRAACCLLITVSCLTCVCVGGLRYKKIQVRRKGYFRIAFLFLFFFESTEKCIHLRFKINFKIPTKVI